jgi:DNA-directed RNA polymerase specialized sigma24 family protein
MEMQSKIHLSQNLYTSVDYAIVRSAVKRLPGLLSLIIEMRFWQHRTIDEITEELGVSMKAVEMALQKAIRMLREECLRNPAFSRSKHFLIQEVNACSVA